MPMAKMTAKDVADRHKSPVNRNDDALHIVTLCAGRIVCSRGGGAAWRIGTIRKRGPHHGKLNGVSRFQKENDLAGWLRLSGAYVGNPGPSIA